MITEDIAVSWKLHLRGYRIKYEPLAMCWMLVPETLGGLWKQRVRWAQGIRSITTRLFYTMKTKRFPLYILNVLANHLNFMGIYSASIFRLFVHNSKLLRLYIYDI
ncbi:glycosyltransferase family 2 protein [Staphylococcus aureus]